MMAMFRFNLEAGAMKNVPQQKVDDCRFWRSVKDHEFLIHSETLCFVLVRQKNFRHLLRRSFKKPKAAEGLHQPVGSSFAPF